MSHTQGPWVLVNSNDIYSELGADSGDGVPADKDDGWHVASIGSNPTMVDGLDTDLGYAVQTANAKLICAAPDLLAALESVVTNADRSLFSDGQYDMARAAIAKARGQV